MPNWTKHDLTRATKRNPGITVKGAGENATFEPVLLSNPLAESLHEEAGSGRFLVRVVSVRKRLADPDGLVPKWHVDALRYLGVIPEDTAKVLDLEVSQRKCHPNEEEHTLIEVFRLNDPVTEVSKEI